MNSLRISVLILLRSQSIVREMSGIGFQPVVSNSQAGSLCHNREPKVIFRSMPSSFCLSIAMLASLVFFGIGGLATGQEAASKKSAITVYRRENSAIQCEKNVAFQNIDGHPVLADLYRPDSQERLPVVVMIHGGAWIAGDKWNVVDHAIQMAESGFVVMAINYRLAPTFPWPAQLIDCRAALTWISEHHERWHADVDRLGVWGYSAGGHLALMIALEQEAGLPRVRACVAGGPPCDLDFVPLKSQLLAGFLGGSREEFPIRYRQASPIHWLSADDPPLFFFHGEQDSIVPIENSQKMHAKVVELGIVEEYRAVPELGHLLTFIDRKSRLAAIEFLKKHLAQSLP